MKSLWRLTGTVLFMFWLPVDIPYDNVNWVPSHCVAVKDDLYIYRGTLPWRLLTPQNEYFLSELLWSTSPYHFGRQPTWTPKTPKKLFYSFVVTSNGNILRKVTFPSFSINNICGVQLKKQFTVYVPLVGWWLHLLNSQATYLQLRSPHIGLAQLISYSQTQSLAMLKIIGHAIG